MKITKITAEEKAIIQTTRDKVEAARKQRTADLDLIMLLTNKQLSAIANGMRAARKRIGGPRPRCTCDSQWTNPKCPARNAGWQSIGGSPCDNPPDPVAWIEVPL